MYEGHTYQAIACIADTETGKVEARDLSNKARAASLGAYSCREVDLFVVRQLSDEGLSLFIGGSPRPSTRSLGFGQALVKAVPGKGKHHVRDG